MKFFTKIAQEIIPLRNIRTLPKEEIWEDPQYLAEPKYRGVQSVVLVDDEGKARFFSRQKTEHTENLPEQLRKLPPEYHNSSFIAELLHPGPNEEPYGDEQFVSGLVHSKPENARQKQEKFGPMQMKLLDLYRYQGEDVSNMPYRDRRQLLPDGVEATQKNKRKFFQNLINQGAEGIVLKHQEAPYRKRMYKVKPRQTYTFQVLDVVPSEKHEWAASLIYGKNGRAIGKVNIAQPDLRKQYYNNPEEIIGKTITISGEGTGSTGAILKPVIEEIKKEAQMKYFQKNGQPLLQKKRKRNPKGQPKLQLDMRAEKLLDAKGRVHYLNEQDKRREGNPIVRLKANPQFPLMTNRKKVRKQTKKHVTGANELGGM